MLEIIFWTGAITVAYVYIGYPVFVALLASLHPRHVIEASEPFEPFVTVLIAAYNEEKAIAETIQNKIDQDYPRDKLEIIVVSDESTDETDNIVNSFALAEVPVTLVRQSPRQGKTAGLNLVAPMAKGEVLVFSDANSIYKHNAIKHLASNFATADIGYVTGKMIYVNPDGTQVGDGCSSYMKYENRIREWETRVGSVIGVDGGIDAMRAALYQPLNADQLPDFVQPLKVVEQGYRVTYEPRAILREDVVSDSTQEYRMRVRVSLRSLWALHDMKNLMNPTRFGFFSLQLISHKLLRYLAFVPLIVLFLTNIPLHEKSYFFSFLFYLQIGFYGLACAGFLFCKKASSSIFLTFPYYFMLLNTASACAFIRYLKNEKQITWTPRAG